MTNFKPSNLRHTYSLTGDRNTELVIEAIAATCLAQGDRWQAVFTDEIDISLMGRPGACPWSEDEAREQFKSLCSRVYSDPGAREREMLRAEKEGPREALLGTLSAGLVLCQAVRDGWVKWTRIDDSLAVRLTAKTMERLEIWA